MWQGEAAGAAYARSQRVLPSTAKRVLRTRWAPKLRLVMCPKDVQKETPPAPFQCAPEEGELSMTKILPLGLPEQESIAGHMNYSSCIEPLLIKEQVKKRCCLHARLWRVPGYPACPF